MIPPKIKNDFFTCLAQALHGKQQQMRRQSTKKLEDDLGYLVDYDTDGENRILFIIYTKTKMKTSIDSPKEGNLPVTCHDRSPFMTGHLS